MRCPCHKAVMNRIMFRSIRTTLQRPSFIRSYSSSLPPLVTDKNEETSEQSFSMLSSSTGPSTNSIDDASILQHSNMLQKEGFSKEQSDALVILIAEAIQDGMHNVSKTMTTKQEQQDLVGKSSREYTTLRESIQAQSQKNLELLKLDLEKLRNEVRSLDVIMKEQVQRTHGNLVLDMNLERGRMKEEIRELEEKLDAVKKSVDTEVQVVVDKVGDIQQDLKKSMYQLISVAFCFFVGYKVFTFVQFQRKQQLQSTSSE